MVEMCLRSRERCLKRLDIAIFVMVRWLLISDLVKADHRG